MKKKEYKIKNILGEEITVIPRMFLYSVKDFMGKPMTIPGIQRYWETDGAEEPFATLTKSFGEFIGAKNTAYIDTNNCDFAKQLLIYGFARNTGLTKNSGFCSYPLWVFDESFLAEIGGEQYQQYSKAFDDYMAAFEGVKSDE